MGGTGQFRVMVRVRVRVRVSDIVGRNLVIEQVWDEGW